MKRGRKINVIQKTWYELIKSVKVGLLMETPAKTIRHMINLDRAEFAPFSEQEIKMEGRKRAFVICMMIVILTLDFQTLAKIMDFTRSPRCQNSRGVVRCARYQNNCVSVFLDARCRII